MWEPKRWCRCLKAGFTCPFEKQAERFWVPVKELEWLCRDRHVEFGEQVSFLA
jgi:hypothetical protein